jgi:hypothetical protein
MQWVDTRQGGGYYMGMSNTNTNTNTPSTDYSRAIARGADAFFAGIVATKNLPHVLIESGAGRHGKDFRVSLIGLGGFPLVDWTCGSLALARRSAMEEFGALEIREHGAPQGGSEGHYHVFVSGEEVGSIEHVEHGGGASYRPHLAGSSISFAAKSTHDAAVAELLRYHARGLDGDLS